MDRNKDKICQQCNKSYKKDVRFTWKRFLGSKTCSKDCWYIFMKGANHPRWTGKNVFKNKNGNSVPACINCDAPTGDGYSIMCKNCHKGALHHSWKGGVSSVQSRIRGIPENKQWIKQCMYRDNYTCQECGVKSKNNNLQVHHIKSFALILKQNCVNTIEEAKNCLELWDIDNGLTLCRDCHKLTFNYKEK
jgi:hypothetical protein